MLDDTLIARCEESNEGWKAPLPNKFVVVLGIDGKVSEDHGSILLNLLVVRRKKGNQRLQAVLPQHVSLGARVGRQVADAPKGGLADGRIVRHHVSDKGGNSTVLEEMDVTLRLDSDVAKCDESILKKLNTRTAKYRDESRQTSLVDNPNLVDGGDGEISEDAKGLHLDTLVRRAEERNERGKRSLLGNLDLIGVIDREVAKRHTRVLLKALKR
mmetsp:Transcript_28309/g.66150  ORF Transcript_28309/g.66150 Transcript_28309/m.66150 type:complete len:214 (-) Transcript_28309:2833-3474(-)